MSARPTRTLRDSEAHLVIAGLLTVAALIGFVALALTAQRGLPLRSYYTVHADVRDAGTIEEYSEVRIAGKLAGQVLGSTYDRGIASLTLQLNTSVEPLRTSTTARIRLKGLLGAKYVDIVPGRTGGTIPDGGTIPISHTSTTVDVFHVLATIDGSRQRDLRQTLDALGEGFLGRGAGLNDSLSAAPAVAANTQSFAAAVVARAGAAARLIPSAQSLTAAFDPVRAELAAGFDPQARVLQSFVSERGPTQSTLQIAPVALPAIRGGLQQTDPLLAQTAGFARAAVALTGVAPRALRQATELLQTAPGPLGQLSPLLDALGSAVPPTLRLTAGLDPLTAPAHRVLDNNLPILRTLGAHGCDVLDFARNWRSLLGYGQASGTGDPIGPSNYVMVGAAVNADAAGPSSPRPASLIGHDPYPAPCAAGTEHLG